MDEKFLGRKMKMCNLFQNSLTLQHTNMSYTVNRRDWLKKSSLAALGLSIGLPSMANEEGLLRDFGMEAGLINLGSNENPYGISPKAKEAILSLLPDANRYQFNVPRVTDFRKELGEYYGVGANQILLTGGSGEALALLARHFNKGNLVSADPTFATLPNTAKKIGTKVIEVPLTADKVHDLPAMLRAIDNNTAMVYICNPANPTTTIVSPTALKEFCIAASKKAVVVVDEAYIDFLDAPDNESMIVLLANHPNVLIVRTFSKIHAMAGMRVGFVIGHPTLIAEMEKNYFSNSRFAVSTLAMTAAMASLKDETHRQTCKNKNAEVRNYMQSELKKMGLRCIPSYTNFLFVSLGNYSGDFAADMLKENFVLRSSVYPDGKWARISLGTQNEMQSLVQVMRKHWS